MNSSVLYILFLYTIDCEWVEISPIINKKSISDVKQESKTTTSANDEVFTPVLENDYLFTTPAYNRTQSHIEQANVYVVTTAGSNKPVSTTELNMPFTMTEEFTSSTTLEQEKEFEEIPEEKTGHTYEGFLPFLKIVQNNLLKYKNKSRSSKMAILKQLRDHLLNNIKERITYIWNPLKTEARGYKEEDTHMDFPSNEGALMTIGFLTFAVFLIKLVIKLVHALKYKQQYYGMSTTTTAASVVFLKRKKRDEDQQEAAKILQYIEEF